MWLIRLHFIYYIKLTFLKLKLYIIPIVPTFITTKYFVFESSELQHV